MPTQLRGVHGPPLIGHILKELFSPAAMPYHIHPLSSLPQKQPTLQSFFNFLVDAFSFKSPAPSELYFKSHYYNDPYKCKEIGDVFLITVTDEGDVLPPPPPSTTNRATSTASSSTTTTTTKRKITLLPSSPPTPAFALASTARTFSRAFLTYKVVGVGEVATSKQHSGKGLSTSLLNYIKDVILYDAAGGDAAGGDVAGGDAEDATTERTIMILHASPTYRPYYAKLGYTSCQPIPYSVLLPPPYPAEHVYTPFIDVELPGVYVYHDHVTIPFYSSQMLQLYNQGGNGIKRCVKYVEQWIHSDALRWGDVDGSGFCGITVNDVFVGYIILRIESSHIAALKNGEDVVVQVRDFHILRDYNGEASQILSRLVYSLLSRETTLPIPSLLNKVKLNIPYEACSKGGDLFKFIVDDGVEDDGWMWMMKEGEKWDGGYFCWAVDSF
jgi:hypothetical protein